MKARKFLEKKKIKFKDIPIVDEPPTKAELKKMIKSYDGEIKKLFNTSGVVYREMKIKDKIADMKESEAVELLSKNGKLIKRPFLLSERGSLVGFKEEEWKQIF